MKPTEDLISKWIREIGPENPPKGMAESILQKINLLPKQSYRPVISPLGWKLILAYIIGISLLAINWKPTTESTLTYLDRIPKIKNPFSFFNTMDFTLPTIEISPMLLTCIVLFMILSLFSFWISNKNQETSI